MQFYFTKTLVLLLVKFGCVTANDSMIRGSSSGFSDEFSQQIDLLNNNTSDWQVLGSGQNDERATIIEESGGWLSVIPQVFSQNAWFEDNYGPLVYQEVSGNFSAVINLRVVSSSDNTSPPNLGFNAGGFVIRDPAGTHNNDENWLMYNMGGQGMSGVTYAREVKKTVNSVSNLFLTEQIGLEEYLLVCRIGQQFRFYYWADAINSWREEHFYNQFALDGVLTTTWSNSTSITPELVLPSIGESTPIYFEHAQMPNSVQVGIMGHTWANGNTQADFNFIRFATTPPLSEADCTSEFSQLGLDIIFVDGFE